MPYNGVATGGGGFNPFAAGRKSYGSGRSMPTTGAVDPLGYKKRDLQTQARRNAILQRLKAGASGNYGSAAFNRSVY
jgi:hypothetical protein